MVTAAATLVACAHLDHFTERAADFNVQVAEAQDKTLLLNIMRAAYRLPMHFTELSTLSGTATVGGTVGLGLPFATFNHGNGVESVSPGVSFSQSPTFNIAVLETQEFYNGMLKPLTPELLSIYFNEGVPTSLILALAVNEISFQYEKGNTIFRNDFHVRKARQGGPGQGASKYVDTESAVFMELVQVLADRKLTVEKASQVVVLGPPLKPEAFADPKSIKELDAQQLQVVRIDREDCKTAGHCPDGVDVPSRLEQKFLDANGLKYAYRIQKKTSSFRFCFGSQSPVDPSRYHHEPARLLANVSISEEALCHGVPSAKPPREGAASTALSLQPESSPAGSPRSVELRTRSTEGVIYFLGELARCELGLPSDGTEPGATCGERPTIKVDYHNGPDLMFQIDRLDTVQARIQAKLQPKIVVALEGKAYALQIDPEGHDRSAQVLRILTQLLALNRSAKDFPAPAVIPILSR